MWRPRQPCQTFAAGKRRDGPLVPKLCSLYCLSTGSCLTMFEARLVEGIILKQIIESIKDLVTDATMEITGEEISIQCMDSSHVALVDVNLSSAAFDHFRCDKALSLGFNTPNMSKILKMMNKDDTVILKAEDDGELLTLMFEANQENKSIADFGESI